MSKPKTLHPVDAQVIKLSDYRNPQKTILAERQKRGAEFIKELFGLAMPMQTEFLLKSSEPLADGSIDERKLEKYANEKSNLNLSPTNPNKRR